MTLPATTAALGANLWVVAIGVPLTVDTRWVTGPPLGAVLALCLLAASALALLVWGLVRRSDEILLAAYPAVTLLPVALLGGGDPEARLLTAPPLAVSAVSLCGYLLAACAFGRKSELGPSEVQTRALKTGKLPERWRRRTRVYSGLQIAAAAIPLVLLWAVNLRPQTTHALARSFGASAEAMKVLLTVLAGALSFALWRAFLVGPLHAHLEQDLELTQALKAARAQARRGRPRPGFYLAFAVVLAGIAIAILRRML
jgi:hypothetical protein